METDDGGTGAGLATVFAGFAGFAVFAGFAGFAVFAGFAGFAVFPGHAFFHCPYFLMLIFPLAVFMRKYICRIFRTTTAAFPLYLGSVSVNGG